MLSTGCEFQEAPSFRVAQVSHTHSTHTRRNTHAHTHNTQAHTHTPDTTVPIVLGIHTQVPRLTRQEGGGSKGTVSKTSSQNFQSPSFPTGTQAPLADYVCLCKLVGPQVHIGVLKNPLPRPPLYPAGNSLPTLLEGYRTQRESDTPKCEVRELMTRTRKMSLRVSALESPELPDSAWEGLAAALLFLSLSLENDDRCPLHSGPNTARLCGAGTGSHRGSAETWVHSPSGLQAVLKPRVHITTPQWSGVPTSAAAILGPNLQAMVRTGRVPRVG